MKRTTSSSNSESQSYIESPHSPLRFHSPLSEAGDPPESRYVSPEGSPFKLDNPKPIVTESKLPPPPPPQFPPRARGAPATTNSSSSEKSPSSMVVFNRWVREEGPETTTRKVGGGGESGGTMTMTAMMGNRVRRDELVSIAALGFRVSEVILCVISFSIMAADKTQGWSGDSYDRYKEYRYCLAVNVIAFVYSAFEACDAACYIAKETYMLNCGFHDIFVFSMDQLLAYLLMSASSCAATRVDDWVSNWGKDDFTQMATASIAVSFIAFVAFAISALISSYRYCLAVNVIAFVYSAFEACDAACYIAKETYMLNCGFHDIFVFSMDQLLAYLLMSASSCAATRVDDWVSNWGKDDFTQMATASIAVSFIAFVAFAISALISSYRLFAHTSS